MLNPNPPRMITVVAAVALILVGMSATILPLDFVNAALDAVQDTLGTNIQVTKQYGYLFMFAGDALSGRRQPAAGRSDMGSRMNFAAAPAHHHRGAGADARWSAGYVRRRGA